MLNGSITSKMKCFVLFAALTAIHISAVSCVWTDLNPGKRIHGDTLVEIYQPRETDPTKYNIKNKTWPSVPKMNPMVVTYISIYSDCLSIGTATIVGGGYGKYWIGMDYTTSITDPKLAFDVKVYAKMQPATLTSGSYTFDDDLLSTRTYTTAGVNNSKILMNTRYPPLGTNKTEIIDYIAVIEYLSGDPKSIAIISGGVGYTYAQIQVLSRMSIGVNVTVQIYGRNYTTTNFPFIIRAGPLSKLVYDYWPWYSSGPKIERCGCQSLRPM